MMPINSSTDAPQAATAAQAATSPPVANSADGAETAPIRLRALSAGAPVRWLARGLSDFRRAPAIGLFYGLCFVAMGWGLLKVYENAPAYMLALSAGFLLMGPFLCMGLY
ncbi:MAG: hypothetical protein RLZZ592_838, partial [Pseudomonadota bacterium]